MVVNRQFTEEEVQEGDKCMKSFSTPPLSGKCKTNSNGITIFAHQMYRNESDSERVWGNWKSHKC